MSAPLATTAARQARARILAIAEERPADQDFLAEASEQLGRIVPFDAAFWAATDPVTTLGTSPARIEQLNTNCSAFWEREFLVEDFNHFRDLARAVRPAASLQIAT